MALLTDLKTPQYERLFRQMEGEQAAFLSREREFRSPEYRWPKDALNNWSRIWEYPFAYHHLAEWATREPGTQVLDFGSGVTFFPFALAKLGLHVTCADIDPICVHDTARAADVFNPSKGSVASVLLSGARMPFENAQFSSIYCISVLEHLPHPSAVVEEMARCLTPGGLLLLTIDIDMKGNLAIGPAAYQSLLGELERDFEEMVAIRHAHPSDLLTSINSPIPFIRTTLSARLGCFAKDLVRVGLRRPVRGFPPYNLAVEALVLRKKSR
jgi:SAM-dependent methyltransferase